MRDWWTKAAQIWVDQERGLYDWGEKKRPLDGDGKPRVVKSQILIDCGMDPSQRDASKRIWRNTEFLKLLDKERRRRDVAIVDVVHEIEAVAGPLIQLRTKMQEHVQNVFLREPDDEDPLALSPHQYVTDGLAWCKYIDELTGRTKSQSEVAIQNVVGELVEQNKITAGIASEALGLIDKYRSQQDKQLANAGFIDSTATED